LEFLGMFCFLAVTLPLFCLAWTAVVARIRPRYGCLWSVASIPAFFVVLSCWMAAASYYATRPAVIFRTSFGFSPTPDVKILNSFRDLANKWDEVYLEFYADEPTIRRIVQKGFAPISAKDIIQRYTAPAWWTPSTGPGVEIYATRSDDPEFRGEFRYFFQHQLLIYDPASKRVHYHYYVWGEGPDGR
jgi:hypothetical protein